MSFNLKYLIIFLSLLMPFSCKRAVKNSTSSKNLEETAFSGDLFEVHVRTTEPLLPEEQKKSFQLPPGFEIELFASEPQIGKPINLAFDSRGRLWVTQSFEYPFAAKNKGRDKITILEDKNGDGRADSFTNFDDTLNIPIGIFPTQDGAIGFSIPHIYKFKDLDNNGKADETQVLYGKFGHKDTHGMVNNLVRGYDGWIHSCHGYTNTSTIVGKDGDTVTLVSGNTFRFKEDGSRIEHTTYGRVNPFGMAFDEWGYLYSADCHSSPIYQMIMGGDYPTFGKKEEAIGFAPAIKPHGSESTALSGLAYYDDNKFPQEYQKNFYLGDVVKSRVYMYSFEKKGSTSILTKETDFLLSTDPWFRPVDVKLGPDGAIYVADFYNRIIDHYEVPLDHPGRDRIRGRIWKITYNPKKVQQANKMPDWSAKNASELIDGLTSPNITERMLITDQLVDRVGKGAIAPLKETLNKKGSPLKVIHSLWSLYRLGALENNLLQQYFKSPDPKIRTHVLRIIREAAEDSVFEPLITKALKDKDANVQRAAVEALGKYPSLRNLSLLLELKKAIPAYDNHLLYTTNLTLRNLLRNENLMKQVLTKIWSDKEKNLLAEVATGVNSSSSAKFLFNLLKAGGTGANLEIPIVRHIAHYLPDQELDDFIAYVQTRFSDNIKAQFQIADNCLRGQRGKLSNGLLQWGISLSKNFLNTPSHWRYQPLNGGMGTTTPITVFTSEQDDTLIGLVGIVGQAVGWLAGIMMSPEFEAPDSLTFTVALSGEIPLKKEKGIYDFVRLKAVNDRDKILVEQQFVRDKMKEEVKIKWNLSAFKGQKVYLEVVKNSYRTGFIGIGNLKRSIVSIPSGSPSEITERQKFAIEFIGDNKISSFEPLIAAYLKNEGVDYFIKLAAARTLVQLAPDKNLPLIEKELTNTSGPLDYKKELIAILGETSSPYGTKVLENQVKNGSKDLLPEIVKSLANTTQGKDVVFKSIRNGDIYSRILIEPGIEDRILLNATEKQRKEYIDLTSNLSSISEEREILIRERLSKFNYSTQLVENGKTAFVQNCSSCHQIRKEGGLIGPQLDGIGNWGAHSLATKILDPNRNISEAFRNYSIKLKNGKVLTGLYRRDEGATIVFANFTGEEFTLAKKDIAEQQPSRFTLMPDHFHKVLDQEKFEELLSYLLSVK